MEKTPTLPRLKLSHILLAVNLVVLGLPLMGLELLRLYESALIRQTESELIAQAAFIAATYRATLARIAPLSLLDESYGAPVAPRWRDYGDGPWRPRPARLDLAEDTIQPPPPDPIDAVEPADAFAVAVGRELTPILRDAQVVTLSGIAVVDARGTIVAATNQDIGRSLLSRDEVRRALRGEHVSLLRQRIPDFIPPALDSISRVSRLRVFLAAPITQDQRVVGAILLSRTPTSIRQVLYGKRYHLLVAVVLILTVVAAVSVFTSVTIARPLQALVRQARRATAGEQGAVVALNKPVTREIAELSEAVTTMARHLEQRADYIRTFAAHVSHEFKTPLAAIQGTVELLRDHLDSMSVAERERFLGNLGQDAERLGRLVRRLLDLARADVMQAASTDVAPVEAVVRRMAARYQGANLRVTVNEPLPEGTVAMAEEVLESILTNLLDNVRQHGGDAVDVAVAREVGDDGRGAKMLIEVADNGPGISPANAARVFEPFFTTARQRGGTGLGLAVVKSLLRAHRGDIRLVESTGGTRWRVVLPARA